MSVPDHRYEIFIRSSTRPVDGGRTKSIWTWRRLDSAGTVLVRGAEHATMVECLWAARQHRGDEDDTPIAIQLLAIGAPDAAETLYDAGQAPRQEADGKSGPDAVSRERDTRYLRREQPVRDRAA